MAKKAKANPNQLVMKLVPLGALKSWLQANAKAKEAKDDINTDLKEHTRETVAKGLDKEVGKLFVKINGFTPEKLAKWRTHFDDMWEKLDFDKRVKAGMEAAAAAQNGEEHEGENEDDAPKGSVTRFPQAAE